MYTCEDAPHFVFGVKMFVPRSVAMRSKGFVLDNALKCRKFGESNWVPKGMTVADRKKAYAAKVDRTVDILHKFAITASRNFRARKVYIKMMVDYYNKRSANARFQWNTPNWGDFMFDQEQQQDAELLAMPEHKWRALIRGKIAEHKEVGQDILPLLRWVQYMDEKRLAHANASRLVLEHEVVWKEMSLKNIGVPVRLHNKQASAKIRVHPNSFAALADSDNESDLSQVDMDELEAILRG